MPADPILVSLEVAEALDACGLKYLIGGSLASSMSGEPRSTLDINFVVLQKLRWYRLGNEVSDQQWRDVLGVVRVQAGSLNEEYLRDGAKVLGVVDLLDRALHEERTE